MRGDTHYVVEAKASKGLHEQAGPQFKRFVNLDEDLLTAVVVAVEELLSEEALVPAPERKAQLIVAVYEMAEAEEPGSKGLDRRRVAPLLRLVK